VFLSLTRYLNSDLINRDHLYLSTVNALLIYSSNRFFFASLSNRWPIYQGVHVCRVGSRSSVQLIVSKEKEL
jgi:hypothetical protein